MPKTRSLPTPHPHDYSDKDSGATTTSGNILIANGVSADITFSGVSINVSGCALDVNGTTLNLILVSENTLKSGSGCAGL